MSSAKVNKIHENRLVEIGKPYLKLLEWSNSFKKVSGKGCIQQGGNGPYTWYMWIGIVDKIID